jgi:hypothetical protein
LSLIAHAKGHTPPKIIGVFLFLTALNAVGVIKMLDGLEVAKEEVAKRGSTPAIALSIGLRQLEDSRYWIHHAIKPTTRCRWSFYCFLAYKYVFKYVFKLKGKKMKDKICKCGLSFMPVGWLHHRVRGWCSYQCRKKMLLEKRNLGKTPIQYS